MRLVAQQAGFFVLRAHRPGLRSALGLPGGFAAQVADRCRNSGGRLAGGQQWAAGARRLLLAHAIERGIGLDRGRVDGLRVARHQAPGKDVVEEALQDRRRNQLAGAAHGRVPGQLVVHFVARKKRMSSRRAQWSMSRRSLTRFSNRPTSTPLKNTTGSSEGWPV